MDWGTSHNLGVTRQNQARHNETTTWTGPIMTMAEYQLPPNTIARQHTILCRITSTFTWYFCIVCIVTFTAVLCWYHDTHSRVAHGSWRCSITVEQGSKWRPAAAANYSNILASKFQQYVFEWQNNEFRSLKLIFDFCDLRCPHHTKYNLTTAKRRASPEKLQIWIVYSDKWMLICPAIIMGGVLVGLCMWLERYTTTCSITANKNVHEKWRVQHLPLTLIIKTSMQNFNLQTR
jgi:hypothetical protein